MFYIVLNLFKLTQIFLNFIKCSNFVNSIKFYFWKILENFLIFVQFFYKLFKIFLQVFNDYIFIECPPEPKFWRRHCSTGLELNSCMKFCFMFPLPNQNPGAATGTTSTLCTAYVIEIRKLRYWII